LRNKGTQLRQREMPGKSIQHRLAAQIPDDFFFLIFLETFQLDFEPIEAEMNGKSLTRGTASFSPSVTARLTALERMVS